MRYIRVVVSEGVPVSVGVTVALAPPPPGSVGGSLVVSLVVCSVELSPGLSVNAGVLRSAPMSGTRAFFSFKSALIRSSRHFFVVDVFDIWDPQRHSLSFLVHGVLFSLDRQLV